MPLPASVTTVSVHIEIRSAVDGTAATGTVTFTNPYPLRDSTDTVVLGNRQAQVATLVDGEATIDLPATDDPDLSPTDWTYEVFVNTNVWSEKFQIELPVAEAPSCEFVDLVPAVTPPVVVTYALGSALTAEIANRTAADLTLKPRRSSPIVWPTGLVAFWDFQGDNWLRSKDGEDLTLVEVSGTTATSATSGPFGLGRDFGDGDVLAIAAADVGALNAAKAGDQVTVGAWVMRSDLAEARCIAGIWKENADRNYALFMDLPVYGGNNSVCGHVSRTGGPSPNIPYSRDYSASSRRIAANIMRFVAFTYDGTQAISYVDGVADSYPTFTEGGAPNGEGLTLVKNPYAFDLGLNRISSSAFTVGAQELSSGYGNSFHGTIGGLFVANRAYTAAEIMQIHAQALDHGDVLATFDFFGEPEFDTNMYSSKFGWSSALGSSATDTSSNEPARNYRFRSPSLTNYFLNRSPLTAANTTNVGIGYFNTFSGLRLSQLDTVKFTLVNGSTSDGVRFCIRIASTWYATNTAYSVASTYLETGAGELQTIDIERTAASWRDLTFTPGSTLSLAGSARSSNLPNGEITGLGFYTGNLVGEVRIKNLQLLA